MDDEKRSNTSAGVPQSWIYSAHVYLEIHPLNCRTNWRIARVSNVPFHKFRLYFFFLSISIKLQSRLVRTYTKQE